jgi:hypothetical protein
MGAAPPPAACAEAECRVSKATGSRERAPDDRLRVPIIHEISRERWWAQRMRAFAHSTDLPLAASLLCLMASAVRPDCPRSYLMSLGSASGLRFSWHRRWLRECDGHGVSGVTDNVGRRSPIGAQHRPNRGGHPPEHGPAQEDDKKQPIDPVRARINKGISAPAAFASCMFTCLISMALLKRTH